jgi:hypothetical protein
MFIQFNLVFQFYMLINYNHLSQLMTIIFPAFNQNFLLNGYGCDESRSQAEPTPNPGK